MVTRSTIDYEKHKKDIFNIVQNNKDSFKAKKFIAYYSSKYNKYNRSFIDWKLAYILMSEIEHINKKGTRWIGIFGVGGTGKTTVAKNISYFVDTKFSLDSVVMGLDEFINKINDYPVVRAKRATVIDEPDDKYHVSSYKGKIVRKILGKMRQQSLLNIICATDLNDVPPYIFKKLDIIIFLPYLGSWMLFKNLPKKKSFIVQDIRRNYKEKGYNVFFELERKKGCFRGHTIKDSPLDLELSKEYLKKKRMDYKHDIETYLSEVEPKKKMTLAQRLSPDVKRMRKKKASIRKIAKDLETSIATVQEAIRI